MNIIGTYISATPYDFSCLLYLLVVSSAHSRCKILAGNDSAGVDSSKGR